MLKKLSIILFSFVLLVIVAAGGYYLFTKQNLPFLNICDDVHAERYNATLCSHIGMRAYTLESMAELNEKDFGPILGVSWRRKGSNVSSPGRSSRYSENNSYYYIVGSDRSDYVFLRAVSQTKVKEP
jgi:hypothetical protein